MGLVEVRGGAEQTREIGLDRDEGCSWTEVRAGLDRVEEWGWTEVRVGLDRCEGVAGQR